MSLEDLTVRNVVYLSITLLVGDAETGTALGTTRLENGTAASGGHTSAETVRLGTLPGVGLVRTLSHRSLPLESAPRSEQSPTIVDTTGVDVNENASSSGDPRARGVLRDHTQPHPTLADARE